MRRPGDQTSELPAPGALARQCWRQAQTPRYPMRVWGNDVEHTASRPYPYTPMGYGMREMPTRWPIIGLLT